MELQTYTPRVTKDLETLASFVRIYCEGKHVGVRRAPVNLKGFDIKALTGEDMELCPECMRLLAHALVKRSHCKMDPKPQCKHCPNQCYAPVYKQKIREVMRYSGTKLLFSGRISYLLHLLF